MKSVKHNIHKEKKSAFKTTKYFRNLWAIAKRWDFNFNIFTKTMKRFFPQNLYHSWFFGIIYLLWQVLHLFWHRLWIERVEIYRHFKWQCSGGIWRRMFRWSLSPPVCWRVAKCVDCRWRREMHIGILSIEYNLNATTSLKINQNPRTHRERHSDPKGN